jgi:hypothetical protein
MHSLQIQKLLIQCENLNEPEDRIALLKKAIAIADGHNDLEWGFDLRKGLINEEQDLPGCTDSIIAFTWLLDVCDKYPETFYESLILMEYKWMVAAACRNASISLAQLKKITDNYHDRLLMNSHTLHSYFNAMIQFACMQGDVEAAQKYLAEREEEQLDDLSACQACEIHIAVEVEFLKGDIDRALSVGADLFSRKFYCMYAPFETFCSNINQMYAAGHPECEHWCTEVEQDLAEMEAKHRYSQTPYVAMLIRYLSSTNPAKAWHLFEKYAERNLGSEDYYDFLFSYNVLPLLKQGDTVTIHVGARLPWFRPDNNYNTKDIYEYYLARATELAQRFDARHGNNYCSSLIVIE